MNNIQYFHEMYNEHRFTLAVDVSLTKEDLFKLLSEHEYGRKVTLFVGKSTVNPADRYVKKVGREIADSRLAPQQFTLNKVFFEQDSTQFVFSNDSISILLKTSPKSNRVHFISAGL